MLPERRSFAEFILERSEGISKDGGTVVPPYKSRFM